VQNNCLQCSDTDIVGWAEGRAFALFKAESWYSGGSDLTGLGKYYVGPVGPDGAVGQ